MVIRLAALTQAYASSSIASEARRYWKRILAGAFCGWLASSVIGALALAFIALPPEWVALIGAGIVWSGTALGAVAAYGRRPA